MTCKKVKRQFFTHLPDSDVDCSEYHFLISEVEFNYDDQTFLDAQHLCTCHDAEARINAMRRVCQLLQEIVERLRGPLVCETSLS